MNHNTPLSDCCRLEAIVSTNGNYTCSGCAQPCGARWTPENESEFYLAHCTNCNSMTNHHPQTGKCLRAGCGVIDPEHPEYYRGASAEDSPVTRSASMIVKTFWEEHFKPYKWKDVIARKIAWRLPHRLIMWCYIRVVAHATTGEYGSTVVPELRAMEALGRYEQDHSKGRK